MILGQVLVGDIKIMFELVGGTFIKIELVLTKMLKENQNLVEGT